MGQILHHAADVVEEDRTSAGRHDLGRDALIQVLRAAQLCRLQGRGNIAGAFGTYIQVPSAVQIGMFPELPIQRFHQVGNAAGIGAKQALISAERRQAANEIVERIEYVELTTHPDFQEIFLQECEKSDETCLPAKRIQPDGHGDHE